MADLIPSLISVFGTISAVLVAFLVLLYQSSSTLFNRTKSILMSELQCMVDCEHNTCKNIKDLLSSKQVEDLKDSLRQKDVDKKIVISIIQHLITCIKNLKTSIDEASEALAGSYAKDINHIENIHLNHLKKSSRNYEEASQFQITFPQQIKRVIGIPLLFSSVFACLYMFRVQIILAFGKSIFDCFILLCTIIGYFYIYAIMIKIFSEIVTSDR